MLLSLSFGLTTKSRRQLLFDLLLFYFDTTANSGIENRREISIQRCHSATVLRAYKAHNIGMSFTSGQATGSKGDTGLVLSHHLVVIYSARFWYTYLLCSDLYEGPSVSPDDCCLGEHQTFPYSIHYIPLPQQRSILHNTIRRCSHIPNSW